MRSFRRKLARIGLTMNRAGIPFEMHIFQEGVHGLSLAKALTANGETEMIDPRAARWVGLCLSWLAEAVQALRSSN